MARFLSSHLSYLLTFVCLMPGCADDLVSVATSQAVSVQPASDSNAFSIYTGEIASPGDSNAVTLEVSASDFTIPDSGSVMLGFLLIAPEDSSLDPGHIDVAAQEQGEAHAGGPRRPDIAGSSNSLTLADVSVGAHDILLHGQHGTVGAYRLELFLAGDANSDFQVDQQDLDLIDSLRSTKWDEPDYLPQADVDRNGVINGGDLQRASRNLGASTRLRVEVPNPIDQFLEPGALSLVGVSPGTFNPRSAPLQFVLSGTEFYPSLSEVKLTINGMTVSSSKITMGAQVITATSVLLDGRNTISFSAVDVLGRPLHLNTIIWAGSRTLRANLVDENGLPFTGATTVRASLSDDASVFVQASTMTGTALFQAVPFRTILFQASTDDNRVGVAGALGVQGVVQIRMLDFNPPSTVDNNDFSQGMTGWDVGAAPVQIVPHVEGVPSFLGAATAASEHDLLRSQRGEPPFPVPAQPASLASTSDPDSGSIVDQDLTLGTSGEGEKSISRTFTTNPSTTAVRVRYRFITSEVPGGWFGSEYNDYFSVSLRSQQGGGNASEINSMNGLGLGAFDYASGATGWREVTLPTNRQGDTIQVDVAVANVGDGFLDSQVVIDFVEETRDQVRPSLAWNNTQGGMDLSFRVEEGELSQATTIHVYWANGAAYSNRIGDAIFSHVVPAGTAEGQHGPIRIAGDLLAGDPAGVTHLIAASSEVSVGPVADVQVGFGANANAAVVPAITIDIVKDGLRAAGQSAGTITSTARTPADQARAMFQNLVNPANPINVNVTNQLNLYAPAGDAVIQVFVVQTLGLTPQQIMQNQMAIRAAMEQEINNQGPGNVSRHCADPNVVSVVDVAAGAFNASNGPLFVGSVQGRVTGFLDERNTNGCYHLEIQLP